MNQQHNNRRSQQQRKGKGKVKKTTKEGGRVIKEKFEEQREMSLPPITALNPKQKDYLNKLSTCNILVVEGLFGTGKSFCAAAVCHGTSNKLLV